MQPHQTFRFAGGPLWFSHAEVLNRGQRASVVSANEVPQDWLKAWTHRRSPIMGMGFETPKVMGILKSILNFLVLAIFSLFWVM